MTKKDDKFKKMDIVSDNDLKNVSGGGKAGYILCDKEYDLKCAYCKKKYKTKEFSSVGESICPKCGFSHNVPDGSGPEWHNMFINR